MPDRLTPPSQPARPSIVANSRWTLLAKVSVGTGNWLLLIALARLGSEQMLGMYTYALAISAPLHSFSNLRLRGIQSTDAERYYAFADYRALRLALSPLPVVGVIMVSLFTSWGDTLFLTVVLVAAYRSIEDVSDVYHGAMHQDENFRSIGISFLLRAGLSILVGVTVIVLTDQLALVVAALLLVRLLVLFIYDVVYVDKPKGRWTRSQTFARPVHSTAERWPLRARRICRLAWLALPLGIASMLWALNTNLPKYVVETELGLAEVGIYSALAYVTVAGTYVVDAIGQAAAPRMAGYRVDNERAKFASLLLRVMLVIVGMGSGGFLVALAFGDRLLEFVYGPGFAEHQIVFIWIVLAAAIWYMAYMLKYAATALRLLHLQPVLFALSTAVVGVLCLVLVPLHGLVGAAWAFGSGAGLLLIGYIIVVGHQLISDTASAWGSETDPTMGA